MDAVALAAAKADAKLRYASQASAETLRASRRLPRPAMSMISNTVTGGTWAVNAGAITSSSLAYADSVVGATCVQVLGTGSFHQVIFTPTAAFDLTGKNFMLWVKVSDPSNCSNLTVYVTSDNFTNYHSCQIEFNNGGTTRRLHANVWLPIIIPWSIFTAFGTGATRTAISKVRVNHTPMVNGTPQDLRVGGCATVPEPATTYPNGVISFCFDDDLAPVAALPKMGQYGYPGTIFTYGVGRVDQAGFPTSAFYRNLVDNLGWEVAAHAVNTANHIDPSTLTSAQRQAAYVGMKQWHSANRFATDLHAYPLGIADAATEIDAANFFVAARGFGSPVIAGTMETVPPAQPMNLRSFFAGPPGTLANFQTAVTAAKTSHAWLIITIHDITASGSGAREISTSDWNALVDYIATAGVPVRLLSDVLRTPAS